MRPLSVISSALLFTSVASAWSFGHITGAFDIDLLYKRDPQAITLGDSDAATPNPTDSIVTSTTSHSSSTSHASSTNTESASGSASSSSGSKTTSSSASKTSTTTQITSFSANLPPGGITMLNPNTASSTLYYKIGNFVTFAWNYTSLSVTPTAVDVLATCTANQHTYTLALNQSVSTNGTGAVTWDTNGYQATATVPLLTETYTLIIYDAAKSISASASPGYLDTFDTFAFGMYTPQPYVNMTEYVCVTCSGATALERQSLAVVGLAATAAVLGATWFTGGWGAL